MRFALVVCGVLFVWILAPIDGRLKYAEVLPSGTLESMRRRPGLTAKVHGHGSPSGVDPVAKGSHGVPSRKQAAGKGGGDEADVRAGEVNEPSISCFPPADLLHTYDWARYHLRHLAEKWWGNEFPQRRTQHPDGFPGDEELTEDRVDQSDLRNSVKRSDYNRELSADLYAQYPSSCACQTKYELLDLGYTHFPRYIVNAICQNRSANSRKCWRGSSCKEIPYKVRVLTRRADNESSDQDHHSTLLPEPLRDYWRFKTVTIAAACQCSI